MSRYTGPRLKIIRRLGTPLPGLMRTDPDLRRPYPPGQHGPTKRKKLSDYALRLMEKQKLRFHYGLSEKQLRKYVAIAFSGKGNSGHVLLSLLERRLDNVAFRAGLAPSMAAARQLVQHGHLAVDGKRVNIPSFSVKPGSAVEVHDKSKKILRIQEAIETVDRRGIPQWLDVDKKALKGSVKTVPNREDLTMPIQEQLIVELYSK